MPALSTIRTPAIEALATELSFAPKPTLQRHLQRIEQLAPAIQTDGLYPQDFIIFRVTGYRPDIHNPHLIPGNALLSDLSALAEHLSQSAKLTPDDLPPDHETIDSLAARWEVSRKSIERYRRLGLVARRIDKGSGHRAIVFLPGPIAWFEEHHSDRLNTASSFSRMDPSLTKKIIRDAQRYTRRLNLNRTHTSARIAQRIGRSSESVRRALIAYDKACRQTGNQPIFDMPLPPDEQLQYSMLAQSLTGKRTGTIAALHNRTSISVSRSINRARHALVRATLATTASHPVTQSPPSLTDPILTTGLSITAPTDLTDLLALLRDHHTPILHEQRTRALAINLLISQSIDLAHQLHPSTPSGRILDLIETNLRWITLLKINLITTQLPLMLTTIEQHIGGPIDTLDPSRASSILQDAIATVTTAIDRHDPNSRGTLAAPVGLAITRWASRLPDIATPPAQGKAGRRIIQGHTIPNWTHALWTTPHNHTSWLRPPALIDGLDPNITTLSDRDQQLLTNRYALTGNKPWSLQDLSQWLNTPPLHAARMAQAALKRAQPTNPAP